MQKKMGKNHLSKWITSLTSILIVGGVILMILGLKTSNKKIVFVPEISHPASEILDLGVVPAMAKEMNLYNENNIVLVNVGFVQITHSNGQEEKMAAKGIINAGDQIRVSEGGGAEIVWFDGSVTRLSAGTEIKVLQASFDPQNINKTKIDLWANRGKIWAKVINLVDGESEFDIRTTGGIAGVRGTTFNYILEGEFPKVEVIEDVVVLEKAGDTLGIEKSIRLTRGQSGTIKRDGGMEMEVFDLKKLEEPYYAENLKKDSLAIEKFKEANMEKIKQWAKPLPGDPGYLEKQQRIQTLLDQAGNPALLGQLRQRAEKIKIYETVALSDPSKIQSALMDLRKKPNAKDYLEKSLVHIERALNPETGEKSGQEGVESIPEAKRIQLESKKKINDAREREVLKQEPESKKVPLKKYGVRPIPVAPKTIEGVIEEDSNLTKPVQNGSSHSAEIKEPNNISPSTEITSEEKHELVFEKIQINRGDWAKRVEMRFNKEIKGRGQDSDGAGKGQDSDKIKSEPKKKLIQEEIAAPNNSGASQGKTEIPAPTENAIQETAPSEQVQAVPQAEQATPVLPVDSGSVKENNGQGNLQSEQAKEGNTQGNPQSDQPKKEGRGIDPSEQPKEKKGQGGGSSESPSKEISPVQITN